MNISPLGRTDDTERRHADLAELRANARRGRPPIGYQDANDMPLHIPEPATRGERWRAMVSGFARKGRDLGGKVVDSIGTVKETTQ